MFVKALKLKARKRNVTFDVFGQQWPLFSVLLYVSSAKCCSECVLLMLCFDLGAHISKNHKVWNWHFHHLKRTQISFGDSIRLCRKYFFTFANDSKLNGKKGWIRTLAGIWARIIIKRIYFLVSLFSLVQSLL